jgi:hypothetical protein
MRIKGLAFILALTLAQLLTGSVHACSCAREALQCQAYWGTAAVFVGRVISLSPTYEEEERAFNFELKKNSRVFRFAVEQGFRGVSGAEVEVRTNIGGGSCGYYFSPGKRYLVYAGFDSQTGEYWTSICSRTRPLEKAQDDLAYILGQADKKAKNGISGTVVMRAVNFVGRHYSSDLGPVAGVTVAAQSGQHLFKATTNADGKYEFRNLPRGRYQVYLWDEVKEEASKLGVIWGDKYDVDLAAGAKSNCTGADFSVSPKAQVSGKVFDSDGEPLSKVRVSAILAAPDAYVDDDRASFESRISDYTEEDGSYVLEGLPPGRYLIGVNIDSTPGKSLPFSPTYYPEGSHKSSATAVVISGDEELEGYDLRLPPPLPERNLKVSVLLPDGRPAKGARVALEDTEFYGTRPEYPLEVNGEGVATLTGFAGRRYWLHATLGSYGDENAMHAEPIEVDMATAGQTIKLTLNSRGYQCTHYKGSRVRAKQ